MVKELIADLARPFALYVTSAATAAAILRFAFQSGTDLSEAAVYVGTALGGVAALYVGKAFENTRIEAHKATVETVRAQAAAPTPPAEALKPTTKEGEPMASAVPAPTDQELPPWRR